MVTVVERCHSEVENLCNVQLRREKLPNSGSSIDLVLGLDCTCLGVENARDSPSFSVSTSGTVLEFVIM